MYYLIEITSYIDGTADSKGVYAYDTKDLAVANFHSKMGGAMKNENYGTELVVVIDAEGQTIKREYYARPIEVVVEETTTEETTTEAE